MDYIAFSKDFSYNEIIKKYKRIRRHYLWQRNLFS